MTEILATIWETLLDTLLDCLKILPILYLTYLAIEWIETRASSKVENMLNKAGQTGPFWGALLGLIPQCGFSSAAASLYATRTITVGTMIAVFLATSDEMLPILISSQVPFHTILIILGIKLFSGILVGFAVDLVWKKTHHPAHATEQHPNEEEHSLSNSITKKEEEHHEHEHSEIHELCERAHCKCHEGQNIFLSALKHTGWIAGILFAVSLAIGLLFAFVVTDDLSLVYINNPVMTALIGLIPNCSASVFLTDIYVKGLISLGSLASGLLINAGVGLLVLFRTNRHLRDNIVIVTILLLSSIVIGFIIHLI